MAKPVILAAGARQTITSLLRTIGRLTSLDLEKELRGFEIELEGFEEAPEGFKEKVEGLKKELEGFKGF
jgi:archaellum component FlaC